MAENRDDFILALYLGPVSYTHLANLEETVDKNGSVVTDYQYDKNIHTDSQFLQESLSQMDRSRCV